MGYSISSETFVNDEGSDFATVTIVFDDGRREVETFASYFDSPSESAVEQAASFVTAFEEAENYTLEERFGPFGLEWEREQLERRSIGADFEAAETALERAARREVEEGFPGRSRP